MVTVYDAILNNWERTVANKVLRKMMRKYRSIYKYVRIFRDIFRKTLDANVRSVKLVNSYNLLRTHT